MRARNASDPTASIHGGGRPPVPGLRSAAFLGILALVLMAGTACVPSSGTAGGAVPAGSAAPLPAEAGTQPSSDPATRAPSPAEPGAQSSPDPVVAAAKTRVEAALNGAVAGGAKPATDRIRTALSDAGFTPEQTEVTAGTTPTGLDAPAVEAAVKVGDECIVGQVRTGSVAVTVFPVLAGGRCLLGSRV